MSSIAHCFPPRNIRESVLAVIRVSVECAACGLLQRGRQLIEVVPNGAYSYVPTTTWLAVHVAADDVDDRLAAWSPTWLSGRYVTTITVDRPPP